MCCYTVQFCVCQVIATLLLGASLSPAWGNEVQSSGQQGCRIPEPVVVNAEGVGISVRGGIIFPKIQGSEIKPFHVVLVYSDFTCDSAAAQVTIHAGSPVIEDGAEGWKTHIEQPSIAVTIGARWGDHYPLDHSVGSVPDNRLVIFPGEATKADLVVVFTGPGQNVKPDAPHQPQLRFRIVASTRL
jgi:hypothetical protein